MSMTDIEKFDRAVWDYLTTISAKIVYASTQMARRTISKQEKFFDAKPWNFISFYRDPLFDIDWDRMNNPATVNGDFTRLREHSDGIREAQYVQNIPVNLTYSVDIWASKAVEVQSIAIALITKLYMQEQVLKVPINPDGEDGRFHILGITWNDNSDLERETEIGKIYRHTINLTIDARITLATEVNTTKFSCVPVEIYEGNIIIEDMVDKEGKHEN